MNDQEARNKFEKIINLIEESKDLAEELGEDLLSDSLDSIIRDLNDKYDEEYAK